MCISHTHKQFCGSASTKYDMFFCQMHFLSAQPRLNALLVALSVGRPRKKEDSPVQKGL